MLMSKNVNNDVSKDSPMRLHFVWSFQVVFHASFLLERVVLSLSGLLAAPLYKCQGIQDFRKIPSGSEKGSKMFR